MNAQNAQLAGALVGLGATITQAMDEIEDFVPCGHPATVVIDGLSSLNDRLTDDQRNDHSQQAEHKIIAISIFV